MPYSSKFIIDHILEKEIDISYMFSGCSSLKILPDISKWDLSYVKNITGLFEGCTSLQFIPEISKWNIKNVKSLKCLFCECSSLLSLPDISNWNTNSVLEISYIFCGCSLLKVIPDISKWKIKNAKNIEHLFDNCSSLIILPDISKWDISNKGLDINSIFDEKSSTSFSLKNYTSFIHFGKASSELSVDKTISSEKSYNIINSQINFFDNEDINPDYYNNFYN